MNPGDVVAAQYVLERKLGRGGMGEVWLARHRLLDESFAIKFLYPHLIGGDAGDEIVQKFIREAKIGVQVDHPNVVKVRGADTYGGTYFIVMDYVAGADLKALIKDRPLTENQIVLIATQVLEALGAAHSRGFIHRDVKPSNILVTRAGKVYLTDFGIAKAMDTVAFGSSIPIFTAEYAAPEQIEPDQFGPVTAATDLYALGVTMYHMATGRPPFTGTTMQVLRQHTDAVAPPAATLNTQLSPNLNAVIMKALAKQPRERFADAAAMTAVLRGTTPPPPPLPLRKRERGKFAAITSFAIGCVGLLSWFPVSSLSSFDGYVYLLEFILGLLGFVGLSCGPNAKKIWRGIAKTGITLAILNAISAVIHPILTANGVIK